MIFILRIGNNFILIVKYLFCYIVTDSILSCSFILLIAAISIQICHRRLFQYRFHIEILFDLKTEVLSSIPFARRYIL